MAENKVNWNTVLVVLIIGVVGVLLLNNSGVLTGNTSLSCYDSDYVSGGSREGDIYVKGYVNPRGANLSYYDSCVLGTSRMQVQRCIGTSCFIAEKYCLSGSATTASTFYGTCARGCDSGKCVR
ncbi:hypothetical protein HYV88_02535 [Candidatus Woesearchaeota archaeon]|nr:hypothetical protein [Candidatus Woesearchaeota archaeon]